MNVVGCGFPVKQGRNDCDQLWFSGDRGEEWMWSAVAYRRHMGGMKVIRCGLPAIQGRNDCDQLRVTGETGEEWRWSAVG